MFYLHLGQLDKFPVFHVENGDNRMCDNTAGDNTVPTTFNLPTYHPDRLCQILIGDYGAVIDAINQMEVKGYSDRIAWTTPIPTGRHGEYISVMSRRITSLEVDG